MTVRQDKSAASQSTRHEDSIAETVAHGMLRLLSISLLLFATVVLGGACNRPSTSRVNVSKPAISVPTQNQIAEFVRKTGVKLPASAQPIGWREARGMDDALWLQVSMPRSDVEGFLNGSPFSGKPLQAGVGTTIPFKHFFTTAPQRYRGEQFALPNARVLNILIDDSDDTTAMVYMMWHET